MHSPQKQSGGKSTPELPHVGNDKSSLGKPCIYEACTFPTPSYLLLRVRTRAHSKELGVRRYNNAAVLVVYEAAKRLDLFVNFSVEAAGKVRIA